MRSFQTLRLAAAVSVSLTGLAALTISAGAADLAMPGLGAAPAVQADEQPVEWGSGWYLRGDVGGGTLSTPDFNSNLNVSSKHTFSSGIGFGYKVNDWMRLDTTLDYHWGGQAKGSVSGLNCPLNMAPPATSTTCSGMQTQDRKVFNWLVNGYADLGTWSGLTPYIGVGVGLSHQTVAGSINYYDNGPTGTGIPKQYVYTDTLGVMHNWDRTDARKGITNFAWSVMGGVAIDVSAHTKLDIGLKYLNMGHISYLDSVTGVTRSKAFTTKAVHVGMRYMID